MLMNWLTLSLFGLGSLSVMSFLITFLTRKGYPTAFVLFCIGLVLTVFYGVQTFALVKYRPEMRWDITLLLIGVGVLSAFGNLALYQAANNAPNPGLAVAIVGMQGGLVALMALVFLKDALNFYQALGLVLALVGVFLMSLGKQ